MCLGLGGEVKSHSLQREGATWHFQQHAFFDATAEIGHWSLLELSNMAKHNPSLLYDEAKCMVSIRSAARPGYRGEELVPDDTSCLCANWFAAGEMSARSSTLEKASFIINRVLLGA